MRRLLVPAIATLLSPLAFGQDAPVEETPDIRRYMVEVIIFEYAEAVSIGTERFLPDMPIVEDIGAEIAGDFVFGDATTEPVLTVIEETVTEQSKVFAKMQFSGLHRKTLMGYEPTGRRVTWDGAALFHFRDGKITSLWVLGDLKSLEMQLNTRKT